MENPLYRLQEKNTAEQPDPFSSTPLKEQKQESSKRVEKQTAEELDVQKPYVQYF